MNPRGSVWSSKGNNRVESYAYFTEVLARMSSGHSAKNLDALLPWIRTPADNPSEHL
ncbi:transposase domain-containing protein [Methylobacterium sp. ID0610]|uniref:transposase domain-containing protein n=1 Tax=Methylobacterium carpenticola TaxID=3344827 RepID=UPI0036B34DA2